MVCEIVEYEFEVWQGDGPIAFTTSADRAKALREAKHYALVYSQDGPVKIAEVSRRFLTKKELAQ